MAGCEKPVLLFSGLPMQVSKDYPIRFPKVFETEPV